MLLVFYFFFVFFFFKQKTAYEMRISDWSSDVCSSDLLDGRSHEARRDDPRTRIGRGGCCGGGARGGHGHLFGREDAAQFARTTDQVYGAGVTTERRGRRCRVSGCRPART